MKNERSLQPKSSEGRSGPSNKEEPAPAGAREAWKRSAVEGLRVWQGLEQGEGGVDKYAQDTQMKLRSRLEGGGEVGRDGMRKQWRGL